MGECKSQGGFNVGSGTVYNVSLRRFRVISTYNQQPIFIKK
jgi:hypothetical protein